MAADPPARTRRPPDQAMTKDPRSETVDLERLRRTKAKLMSDCPRLFQTFPLSPYMALLDQMPLDQPYTTFTPQVAGLWKRIIDEHGKEQLEILNRATMLELMERFLIRNRGENYPSCVRGQYYLNFSRILDEVSDFDFGNYDNDSDIFHKDFALCRENIFPIGPGVVERNCGFSRSVLFSNGVRQFLDVAHFLIFVGPGNSRYFQIHTHLRMVQDFNPDGWEHAYRCLAEMLKYHPETKGVFRASWFCDPALEEVSPNLAYIRKMPQDNGADVFYIGPDKTGGPFARSQTRRRLFEEGKYLPKTYILIWPRKSLISWSERNN